MTAPTFLAPRPAVPLSAIAAQSQKQQRALKLQQAQEDMARDFAERKPVLSDADAVADRAWPQFDGWIVTLMRAQSNCGAGRNAEMRGDLEDLAREIGEALRGAA